MTDKTFTKVDKKGHSSEWEWKDTPELIKFRQEQERKRAQDASLGYDTEGK